VAHDRMTLTIALVLLLVLGSPALGETGRDPETGRIILVPLNLAVPAATEVETGIAPVWEAILAHFAAQERPVSAIERTSGRALWNDVMSKWQASGDEGGVVHVYSLFAVRLAEQLEYEEIVFPTVVTRAARVDGQVARWDGVERPVAVPVLTQQHIDTGGSEFLASRDGIRGDLAAASLHVAVLRSDGSLRFEGTGGLALLQDVVRSARDPELVAKLRQGAFEDGTALRRGVEAAFRSPLPAARAE